MFSTPKRAVISTICIMTLILAVLGGILAAVVGNGTISKKEAREIALADAGLEEAEVLALRVRSDFDDGHFEYEVDFYSGGAEYEYVILARDGDILSREIEGGGFGRGGQGSAPARERLASQENPAGAKEPVDQGSAAGGEISLDDAKAAALADADLSEGDVTFTKEKLGYEDGVRVYDVSFYTAEAEYDYEIKASDGTVSGRDIERFAPQLGGGENGNVPEGSIGADRAREIALEHAGLNGEEVQFTRAELDYDDGRAEYEIEFYYGRSEYSCTVDAVSGDIIEYEADRN